MKKPSYIPVVLVPLAFVFAGFPVCMALGIKYDVALFLAAVSGGVLHFRYAAKKIQYNKENGL